MCPWALGPNGVQLPAVVKDASRWVWTLRGLQEVPCWPSSLSLADPSWSSARAGGPPLTRHPICSWVASSRSWMSLRLPLLLWAPWRPPSVSALPAPQRGHVPKYPPPRLATPTSSDHPCGVWFPRGREGVKAEVCVNASHFTRGAGPFCLSAETSRPAQADPRRPPRGWQNHIGGP